MTVEREIRELEDRMKKVIGLFWKSYHCHPAEEEKVTLELKREIEYLIWDLQAVFHNLVALTDDPDKYPIEIIKPPRIRFK
ncbi:MAG: hypothetical protein DRP00_05350 [Candidatus Aenigmatarchaeota archaeon]|nr:MAG: hypothetical protein DRP00_05350 [Candidatus Aenigmarchaeota archaeon]